MTLVYSSKFSDLEEVENFLRPTQEGVKNMNRCHWVDLKEQIYIDYHDQEWGVPVYQDSILFEFLVLESFQAGLSWICVLKKREAFRKAMDGFDPIKIANYKEDKIQELLQNKNIIRSRRKIDATIQNAKIFLQIQ